MGRAPCCDNSGLKKGPWMPEEDDKLINYIQTHGSGSWRTLPKNAGLHRCGKSCRLRWANYLRPDIRRGRFTFDEEETIIQLHSVLGNKWSAIAARLPGRTDNEIKNYWNTHIRKRLLRTGIDPVTHAPRFDLINLLSHPSLLNLTSLLRTQALLSPEALRLASTILALKNDNSDLLSQTLQENQPAAAQDCINFGDVVQIPHQSLAAPTMLRPNYCFPDPEFPQGNSNKHNRQGFGIDSVLSTPVSSSTPLTSSSTLVNSVSEEENGQSYCSNYLLDFEIPESFDIGDLL